MNNKEKIFWELVKQNRQLAEMLHYSIDRIEMLYKRAEEVNANCRAFETEVHLKNKLSQLNEREFQKEQQRKRFQKQTKEKDANNTKAGIRLS